MNNFINVEIRENQFFNIKDNELIIGSSKEIGILELTDFVAKNIFTKLNKTELKDTQYQVLYYNLEFIKTKIGKHNNAWSVKLANWLGLNILINRLGLDKYSFFANLKTCDTRIIDSFIDEQVIKNLRAEGFHEEVITRILNFIKKPEHDSLSLDNLYLTKMPTIIFTHPTFSHLKRLDLSGNRLATLPAEVGNLTNLKQLDLSGNRLATLPAEVGNLTNLKQLNLSANQLTALPAEVGNLANLLELYLDRNKLTILPAEVGNLANLLELYLDRNKLTILPAEVGNLTNLKQLNLSANQLIALPAEVGNLTNLRELDLHSNKLTTLPAEICRLTNLQELNLYLNQLTALPAEICRLTDLQKLNLGGNELTTLPAEICRLTDLQKLNLGTNRLTTLPAEINNLTMLIELRLTRNRSLTGLPNEILRLPQTCTVELTGCDLSQTVLSNLRQATSQPEYAGPTFSYSMEAIGVVDGRSTEELLKELFQKVNQAYDPTLLKRISNTSEEKLKSLRTWLSRLSLMKDYQSVQSWLPSKILSFLNLAIEDKNFSDKFYVIINGAADTCGDRMALSVINLGVAYQLTQPMEIKALAEFLKRGVWAMDLLEQCARQKVPTLRLFDEVEVYLGYPVRLKDKLQLPIDIKEMLYFRCSALTENDLKNAFDYVNVTISNKEAFYNFLSKNEFWLATLAKNYSNEYQEIVKEKESAESFEDPNYEAIGKSFNDGMLALTKKALGA